MPVVSFTGHPLPDVGVATLCALRGKRRAEELTLEDLDAAADELAGYYFSGLMTSYLTCVFMNAAYVQPSMGEGARQEYENRVLRAHRWSGDGAAAGLRCAYSGLPATHLVHRSQVPMLTGEGVLNFFPAGQAALPIAGPYLVAVQAVPLGGRRAEGRLLLAHSDDSEITIALAERYLADNRRLLQLGKANRLPIVDGPDPALEREHAAKDGNRAKYPDAKAPMSMIASDLLDLSLSRGHKEASITVYVMSNSGQGPSLELHRIPSEVVRFMRLVSQPPTGAAWRSVVNRSWSDISRHARGGSGGSDSVDPPTAERGRKRVRAKRDAVEPVRGGPGRSRNTLLADLFAIFSAGFTDLSRAHRFARRHLLRGIQWRHSVERLGGRANAAGGRKAEIALVEWSLVDLFATEVLGMDAKRVERIREFADKLAMHIARSNDRRFFQEIVFGRRPWEVRNAVTKAQRDEARERNYLLFGLDEYLDVFEADDAVGISDWALIRDLVSIRLVEALHARRFFEERSELLAAPVEDAGEAV
jgi:CRISPR-associated protein Cst1